MSAVFIIRYRKQPVRFTFKDGSRIWGIVPVGMATPFTSEAEAWGAAMQHGLAPEHLEIENRNAIMQEAK